MQYLENQGTISRWAVETFGGGGTLAAVVVRAKMECDELLMEMVQPNPNYEKVWKESADVYITLCRAAERQGLNWQQEIDLHKEQMAHIKYDFLGRAAQVDRLLNSLMCVAHELAQLPPTAAGAEPRHPAFSHALIDVGVLLHQICSRSGGDLLTSVDEAMAVNRVRRWKLDGRGCGQHV